MSSPSPVSSRLPPSSAAKPFSAPCPPHPRLDAAYTVGQRLGRGCFASVFKALRRSDNLPVALKVVEKARLDEDTSRLLQNELQILRAVSEHPGIVTLLDSIETDSHVYFVLQYVDGGPLLDRIVSRGNFSENDARILLRTTLLTLEYLARLGCVHRDIKPENILVDNHSRNWPVKLTDFGLSAKLQQDELLHDALGTPLFVAPEILKGKGYDCSCDMWSVGVVLYIVLCGYPPFPFYDTPSKLIAAIIAGNYTFPSKEWDHVSADAKDVLCCMLEVNPEKRMTPTEALAHPWFSAVQSHSDLPNTELKSFNARRKLKASMFAVRTTFDLMNFVGDSKRMRRRIGDQERLLRDVEKSRALILELGGGASSGAAAKEEEEQQPSLRKRRRSLVLPMHIMESEEVHSSNCVSSVESVGCEKGESGGELDSQWMGSRARAMVAEMKEGEGETGSNPFLVGSSGEIVSGSMERGGRGRSPRVAQLDLKSLGII